MLGRVGASLALLLLVGPAAVGGVPWFEEVVIDPRAGEVVYAVAHADVDGDGRQDVVALTEGQVLWYKAPDWTKGVILDGKTERDNVAIASHDVDGDGRVDFAVAAGWLNGKNLGTLQWLSRGPTGEEWKVHFIGAIPWAHRVRWADALGTGTSQLVVSPLNKTDGEGVDLTAFEVPADPKTARWPATVLDDALNRMHNHWHVDRGGAIETLTASQEGLHVVRKAADGFARAKLSAGASGAKPTEQGAGEVKAGSLKAGKRLIATVEPMHGHMAVAYVERAPGEWARVVLDDTLGRGHAVALADLDGDGGDEVVVGHSDPAKGPIKGPGVYVYEAADEAAATWTKHVVDDGGMATEDLFVLDLTGDGRPDILAGGRNTRNVKLYVNRGE